MIDKDDKIALLFGVSLLLSFFVYLLFFSNEKPINNVTPEGILPQTLNKPVPVTHFPSSWAFRNLPPVKPIKKLSEDWYVVQLEENGSLYILISNRTHNGWHTYSLTPYIPPTHD